MLRLLTMFVFLRLCGLFYLLNMDQRMFYPKKNVHVYAQIISDHNNYYDVLIKTLDGRPTLLRQHMTFFCDQVLQEGSDYWFDFQMLPIKTRKQSPSWYQRMWQQTHHKARLIGFEATESPKSDSLRTQLVKHIKSIVPDHPLKPIVASLIWGDRHHLPKEVNALFISTGTAHLLAISGLHIAWVVGLVLSLSRSKVFAILLGWGYVCMALAPPSAVRAMLMTTLITLLPDIGWIYLCLLTLFIHLVCLPEDILSMSTLLSYWAIIMIRFVLVFGLKGWLQFSVALTILMMPISLYLFQQWPISSLWLNPVIVPIFAGILLPLILIALLLSLLGLPSYWHLVYRLLNAIIQTLALFEDWPKLYLSKYVFIGCMLMQLIIFYVVVKRPKWPYWLLSFICVFIIIDHPIRVPMGSFSLIMLDVGQGLSICIKTHNHAVLYDTGTRSAGRQVVLPFLQHQGINQLSHIIISHWDEDHVGGLALIQNKSKATLITSDPANGSPCLYGQTFELDGVNFTFYHPTHKRHKSKNKDSCVLMVSNRNKKAIILGDIDQYSEQELVKRLWGQNVDLMVAAHHGSKGSNGYPLLYTLHPKIIWVSAGRHNPYHHPHKESMNRFYSVTNQVKVTAIDGQQYFDG